MSRNVFWIQQEGGSCYQVQFVSLCFLLVYSDHWYWEISMRIVYWFLLIHPCGPGVVVWSSTCALFWLEPPLRNWVLFSWVCLYVLLRLLPCSFLKPFVLLFCGFSVWLLCVLGSVFSSLFHLVFCVLSYCLIGTSSFGLGKILLRFAWKYCLCLWPEILPFPLFLLFVDLVLSDLLVVSCLEFKSWAFPLAEVSISSALSCCRRVCLPQHTVGEPCLWGFCLTF